MANELVPQIITIRKHRFSARKRLLSDDAVRAIRCDDRPLWVVAHAYGVSETHIGYIRTRKRKAHVA